MYQPGTYVLSVLFMSASMLYCGSRADCLKMCSGYKSQLSYWDYVIGVFVSAAWWGLTLGAFGSAGLPFLANITKTNAHNALHAVAGGIIFNLANLLLVVTAIIQDAMDYWMREASHPTMIRIGITLSLIAGVQTGCLYPFVSKAMNDDGSTGPYTAVLFFPAGVALCFILVNSFLMRVPHDKTEPIAMRRYHEASVAYCRQSDLAHGRADKFSGFTNAYYWPCLVLFSWTSLNNDFSVLGRLCLA